MRKGRQDLQYSICNVDILSASEKVKKTFDYIPLLHRLQLLYTNPSKAQTMQTYRHDMMAIADGMIVDYMAGTIFQHVQDIGMFDSRTDLALALALDEVSLFKLGNFSVTPSILLRLNLRTAERILKENNICLGITLGPASNRRNLASYLQPVDPLVCGPRCRECSGITEGAGHLLSSLLVLRRRPGHLRGMAGFGRSGR